VAAYDLLKTPQDSIKPAGLAQDLLQKHNHKIALNPGMRFRCSSTSSDVLDRPSGLGKVSHFVVALVC
jgi:hypothetical protein